MTILSNGSNRLTAERTIGGVTTYRFDTERLRSLRLLADLKYEPVAFAIRRSTESVRSYEAGRSFPSVEVLIRMCEFFGCEPGDLVVRVPEADDGSEDELEEELEDETAMSLQALAVAAQRVARSMETPSKPPGDAKARRLVRRSNDEQFVQERDKGR